MLNPNEIDPKHLPSMQAALLKNRSKLDEHRIARLYRLAKAVYADPKVPADSSVLVARSTVNDGKLGLISVTCTDAETGLFIQLTGDTEKGNSSALLTFGKKFCQEHRDAMRQNIATTIW